MTNGYHFPWIIINKDKYSLYSIVLIQITGC